MLRLSKLTDYAVVVLTRLGDTEPHAIQTAPCIAKATGVPEPTVAKVLKALAQANLVAATRGAHGGYRLTRPFSGISVADVIAAIDGPIALTACVDTATGACEVACQCAVRGRWNLVNNAISAALGAITLADMEAASLPPSLRLPPRQAHPTEPESFHA